MKTAAFFQRLNYVLRLDTPGAGFVGLLRERARRSPARGFQRLQAPLGGCSKADHAAGSFARRSGKADCAARTSSRRSAEADRAARTSSRRSAKAGCAARTSLWRSAKADHVTRTSSRRSAKADRVARTSLRRSGKADNGGRLCPGGAFSAARPAGTARFLLRNGDVWATESLFLFAVLWLAFLPDQSETGVAGGGKARRPETPAAPRRPAQRPRPAPGFRAASANARPGDPAPVRLLEKALWVPQRPNLSARRRAESPKGEGKEEPRWNAHHRFDHSSA